MQISNIFDLVFVKNKLALVLTNLTIFVLVLRVLLWCL